MKNKEIIFPRPDGVMEHAVVKFRIGYGSDATTVSIKTDDPEIVGKLVEIFGLPGLTQCFANGVEYMTRKREEIKQQIKNL